MYATAREAASRMTPGAPRFGGPEDAVSRGGDIGAPGRGADASGGLSGGPGRAPALERLGRA